MSMPAITAGEVSARLLEFQGFMDRLLTDKSLSRGEVFHRLADHYTKASRRDRDIWAEVFMMRLSGLLLVPDGGQ